MFAMVNRMAARSQSPRWMKNRQAVATAPRARKAPSIFFFTPAKSATAPSTGDSTAVIERAMNVVVAKRKLATSGSRSAPATVTK